MTRKTLKITLPLPPSVNHCYTNALIGERRIRVLTKRGKAWMEEARWLVKVDVGRFGWECADEKVVVEYEVYWPDRRTRDASNLEKLLLDALEGMVYTNDKWALPRCMDYMVDKYKPGVVITCYRKGEDEQPQ